MATDVANQLISGLKRAGIEIGPSLGPSQRTEVEEALNLELPPDLADLLEAGVPVGDRFPDWNGGPTAVADLVAAPIEGLVFDVEHNGLWLPGWGPRPADMPEAIREARDALAGVPRLVPVWGHRYLPTEPHSSGNPVLSIVQTDIVVYGRDLADYFSREFHTVPLANRIPPGPPPEIPFWGQFLD